MLATASHVAQGMAFRLVFMRPSFVLLLSQGRPVGVQLLAARVAVGLTGLHHILAEGGLDDGVLHPVDPLHLDHAERHDRDGPIVPLHGQAVEVVYSLPLLEGEGVSEPNPYRDWGQGLPPPRLDPVRCKRDTTLP